MNNRIPGECRIKLRSNVIRNSFETMRTSSQYKLHSRTRTCADTTSALTPGIKFLKCFREIVNQPDNKQQSADSFTSERATVAMMLRKCAERNKGRSAPREVQLAFRPYGIAFVLDTNLNAAANALECSGQARNTEAVNHTGACFALFSVCPSTCLVRS